jgi:hypothetical protein
MSATAERLVKQLLVSPKWVAEFYDVPLSRVYYAIRVGRIQGIKVPGGDTIVIDRTTLPERI